LSLLLAVGDEKTLPSKVPYRGASRGDRLVATGPNGGGYGDPFERDPVAVFSDMLDGYISAEQAQTDYGVVIRGKALDLVATDALRASAAATK
jgi:N-methylhydantoinase B